MKELKDRFRKWMGANHTESELMPPVGFFGSTMNWLFELSINDIKAGKLPKEFIELVNEHFDRIGTKPRLEPETKDYIDIEIPGSDGMGNPASYNRVYLNDFRRNS